MNLLKKFAADESGATAIEYGLIAALMAVVVIAAINILGPSLTQSFTNVGSTLTNPTVNVTPNGNGGTQTP